MTEPSLLIDATDAHFAWLLGETPPPSPLAVPPGGIDEPWVLEWTRGNRRRIEGPGSWLMIADGEVVGLCGYKNPPDAKGGVEIGYGVAPERRRRGHATRAVTELVAAARLDPRVIRLFAQTALSNRPSQRVLEVNGFEAVGKGHDEDEGETIVWRLKVGA
jgi:RimJ/RimL family protein N-acetyltransferase